jgi:hypothetical protein
MRKENSRPPDGVRLGKQIQMLTETKPPTYRGLREPDLGFVETNTN